MNGGLPVRISQRIAPRPKTSARSSTRSTSPRACSGAMYDGRAQHLPACEASASEPLRTVVMTVSLSGRRAASSSAMPPLRQDLGQAPVHHLHLAEASPPSRSTGFRSRWITPRAWA